MWEYIDKKRRHKFNRKNIFKMIHFVEYPKSILFTSTIKFYILLLKLSQKVAGDSD